ncbi:hypothetical protein [Cylindrospermum stagnale]|nr:hypothetical protein [Cylindrospermum stagnale]
MTKFLSIYRINPETLGLGYGFLGVLGFSLQVNPSLSRVNRF